MPLKIDPYPITSESITSLAPISQVTSRLYIYASIRLSICSSTPHIYINKVEGSEQKGTGTESGKENE